MQPTNSKHLVAEIRLCAGIYKPTCDDLPAVEVFCQAIVLNGAAYVWIDGVNPDNPVLLPVQTLSGFRSMGTLREYLEDDKHLALGEEFDLCLDICMAQQESATVLIRACEIMHAESLPADQAVVTARQWGMLLNDLDQAERAAYQIASAPAPLATQH